MMTGYYDCYQTHQKICQESNKDGRIRLFVSRYVLFQISQFTLEDAWGSYLAKMLDTGVMWIYQRQNQPGGSSRPCRRSSPVPGWGWSTGLLFSTQLSTPSYMLCGTSSSGVGPGQSSGLAGKHTQLDDIILEDPAIVFLLHWLADIWYWTFSSHLVGI